MKFRDTPLLPWAIGLVLGSSAALAFRHSPSAALLAIGMATALAAPPSARRWVLPAFVGLAWATVRLDVAVERDADAPAHPIVATVVVLGHVEGAADAPRVVVGLRSIARYGRPSTVRPLRGIAWLSLPAADFDAIPGAGAPLLARPAPGAVLRLRGWAGRPRPPANPLSLPAPPLVLRIGSWRLVDVVAEAPAAGRWASALRSGLERRLEAAVEAPRTSSLVRALLLGDRSRLPKRWSRTVDGWGATHLLAVSGLHIGLAALLVGLTLAPLPPTWHALRPVAMAAAIGLYCLLVGPKPSVLRAGAMASAALAAHSLRRASAGVDLLILAVVGLLAWRPAMVGELGFRLSVLATSAILIATEPLACRLSALPQALRRPAAASIAAQLATTPLLVPLDGGIHLWAPMLDLAAVPWLIVALSLAFGWALAGDSMLGRSCWRGLDVCGSALDALAGLPANWPRRLTVEPSLAVGLLAAIVICLAFVGSPRLRLALLAAALLLFGGPPPSVPPSLVLLDVGQGEAILIRDGRRALLVDGGGWRRGDIAARVVAPALAELGVARLDAMVLTHPDLDHCDGLVGLLEQVPVAEVWASPGWDETCHAALISRRGPRWRPMRAGDRLRLGEWRLDVLWPPPRTGRISRLGSNDRSLVLLARHRTFKALLAGDLEWLGERKLARRLEALDVGPIDLLKVPHHGSRTSTSERLLAVTRPTSAWISAAAGHRFGHPHAEVLERLRLRDVTVWGTDRAGQLRALIAPRGASDTAVGWQTPAAERAAPHRARGTGAPNHVSDFIE